MSLYPGAARERLIYLDTMVVAEPPTRATRPHITISPRTAQGLPTQGIALVLLEPETGAAVGGGGGEGDSGGGPGGFHLTLYRSVPTVGAWAELAPFVVLARYGEQYVLPDLTGGWGLYIQITGAAEPGLILVGIAETD
jgi:hypothetical protein